MIYKSSYIRKELRQAYTEYKISISRLFTYGVFLGLAAFAVHFLLQTVYESVLTEKVPEIMLPSYFSVISAYNIISYIFFLSYFLYFYDYLTFSEIRDNSWYLLIKMKFSPVKMIFTKLAVRLFTIVLTYTVGFLTALLLTTFLKYPFVPEYFLPLFFSGLFDIVIVALITMTLSLYIKTFENARIVVLVSAASIYFLKIATGYYALVSNRQTMKNIGNLFDIRQSAYQVLFGIFCIACILTSCLKARNIAKYYSVEEEIDENIAVQDYRTNKIIVPLLKKNSKLYRIINAAVNAVLLTLIAVFILMNAAVLVVSVFSKNQEADFMGYIPYIFQSDTMKPDIQKNDLVLIRKIDTEVPVNVQDIVICKSNNTVYIEKVMSVDGDTYTLDILYYPPASEKDVMKINVGRDDIYGIYFARYRWLGALILFANTIFGRLLFLLIPAFLLFFYKPIIAFFVRSSKTVKK